ncbi:uncharacterized protein LOC132727242 isoform X1 [Ruditapes philippinarum]|uniref:uncharacterized protein LOC132727242 isoform X1 n=1 Tax=Ruditapes philippinarum TaxID=129788 RepID=UPI00295C1997|nr:uncharacterized protein LOC132727242 isoform X1 [Ruditapes philippinarum]XP_060568647.1 uncharacterized protein LOC132727242 isoform X1 [Ruditapes philippinarum]
MQTTQASEYCNTELIAGYSNGLVELTETELEKDLAAYCRNITPMYAKCIEKSAAMQNCHSSQYIFDIKELTTDWLSIYCNNDDISDWLKEYLRHGFRYKNTCGRNDICYTCFFDLVYNRDEHIFTGENIRDYNIWAKRLTADWFACTKEKLPLTQASFPDCTSSWQDVLFLTFLYESARFNPGLRLYQDQMTQILNLKTASSIPLK